jgi:hypothetical protein
VGRISSASAIRRFEKKGCTNLAMFGLDKMAVEMTTSCSSGGIDLHKGMKIAGTMVQLYLDYIVGHKC